MGSNLLGVGVNFEVKCMRGDKLGVLDDSDLESGVENIFRPHLGWNFLGVGVNFAGKYM